MRKSFVWFTLMATLFVTLVSPLRASASRLEEFVLYPFIQYFNWEEYKDTGERVLEETGPQGGVGTLLRVDLNNGLLMLQAKGELFGGIVDYDGQTQASSRYPENSEIPVDTDVDYFGTKLEADLGLRVGETKGTIEPFVGIGYRYWIRDLNDSVAVNRLNQLVPISGYTEEWQSFYTRWGLRGSYAVNDDFKLFAEVGGKYPIYNENRIDEDDLTIKPGKQFSPFAEAGFRIDRFRATVFYEGFRFSQSSWVFAGFDSDGRSLYFSQPKSESDIIGITLGYCFQ